MAHGALGKLDAILTFQDGADLGPTHRQPLFSISRLEHAQPPHEHTEQPTTILRRRNMMSALPVHCDPRFVEYRLTLRSQFTRMINIFDCTRI